MLGHIILRLTIWFLLTANFSPANIIIGVAIAFLLPVSGRFCTADATRTRERLGELFIGIWEIIKAIPQAYTEAIELILKPHLNEEIILERVPPGRSPGRIFLDIFLITFTPKTTVLKYRETGFYEIHRVWRR